MTFISIDKYQQLFESRESKNISKARGFLKKAGVDEPQRLLDAIRHDIPNARLYDCKFLYGVCRMYVNKELTVGGDIISLNNSLLGIKNVVDTLDNDLNSMSCKEFLSFAKPYISEMEYANKSEMEGFISSNKGYKVVKITTFEEAAKFSRYTTWCVTQHVGNFNAYTNNGFYYFYIFLKEGFENIEPVSGENTPFDEYGLSMIAVSVKPDNSINTATSRWNHSFNSNIKLDPDHLFSPKQLSDITGLNFYDVCVPFNLEKEVNVKIATGEYSLAYNVDGIKVWSDEYQNCYIQDKDGKISPKVYKYLRKLGKSDALILRDKSYLVNLSDIETADIITKNGIITITMTSGYFHSIITEKTTHLLSREDDTYLVYNTNGDVVKSIDAHNRTVVIADDEKIIFDDGTLDGLSVENPPKPIEVNTIELTLGNVESESYRNAVIWRVYDKQKELIKTNVLNYSELTIYDSEFGFLILSEYDHSEDNNHNNKKNHYSVFTVSGDSITLDIERCIFLDDGNIETYRKGRGFNLLGKFDTEIIPIMNLGANNNRVLYNMANRMSYTIDGNMYASYNILGDITVLKGKYGRDVTPKILDYEFNEFEITDENLGDYFEVSFENDRFILYKIRNYKYIIIYKGEVNIGIVNGSEDSYGGFYDIGKYKIIASDNTQDSYLINPDGSVIPLNKEQWSTSKHDILFMADYDQSNKRTYVYFNKKQKALLFFVDNYFKCNMFKRQVIFKNEGLFVTESGNGFKIKNIDNRFFPIYFGECRGEKVLCTNDNVYNIRDVDVISVSKNAYTISLLDGNNILVYMDLPYYDGPGDIKCETNDETGEFIYTITYNGVGNNVSFIKNDPPKDDNKILNVDFRTYMNAYMAKKHNDIIMK